MAQQMQFPTQNQVDELNSLRYNVKYLTQRLGQSEAENMRLREENKKLAAAAAAANTTTTTTTTQATVSASAAKAAAITRPAAIMSTPITPEKTRALTQVYTPRELAAKLQEAEREIQRLRQPGAETYAPASRRKGASK